MRYRPYLFSDDLAKVAIKRQPITGINPWQIPQFPGIYSLMGVGTVAPFNTPPDSAYCFPAINFDCISPYAIPFWNDLPPALVTGDVRFDADGKTVIVGEQHELALTKGDPAHNPPQPQSLRGPYGDMQSVVGVLAAGELRRILGRATFKRKLLQIQNRGVVNDMNYNFGAPSSAITFGIPAGGQSSFLDAVPQNELWISSVAGTTFVIGYIDAISLEDAQ